MKQNSFKIIQFLSPDKIILKQVKKKGDIIYGARAMNAQLPEVLKRKSIDYDIFSRGNPRKSAIQMERKLDKSYGGDFYYTKPAQHKGTYKVMDRGVDGRRGTKDDFGIVDYTRKPRGIKTKLINGVRYVQLQEIRKDKRKSLRDKSSAFRHQKDRRDLETMKRRTRLSRGKTLRVLFKRKRKRK